MLCCLRFLSWVLVFVAHSAFFETCRDHVCYEYNATNKNKVDHHAPPPVIVDRILTDWFHSPGLLLLVWSIMSIAVKIWNIVVPVGLRGTSSYASCITRAWTSGTWRRAGWRRGGSLCLWRFLPPLRSPPATAVEARRWSPKLGTPSAQSAGRAGPIRSRTGMGASFHIRWRWARGALRVSIIPFALYRISEHSIGFGYFHEPMRGIWIPAIMVGVVYFGEGIELSTRIRWRQTRSFKIGRLTSWLQRWKRLVRDQASHNDLHGHSSMPLMYERVPVISVRI